MKHEEKENKKNRLKVKKGKKRNISIYATTLSYFTRQCIFICAKCYVLETAFEKTDPKGFSANSRLFVHM